MTRCMRHETIAQVLVRLGIDPSERFDAADQDAQYTACRAEELAQYFDLYNHGVLSVDEKRVLCCFMLESLNEIVYSHEHPLHDAVINALLDDEALHKEELDYWIETDDSDESNWWPVRKGLLRVRSLRETHRK